MTKNDLLNGKRFMLDNEEYQAMIENDDIRSAEIYHEDPPGSSWATGFKIWFNGKLIHSSKTFPAFKKRLEKLIYDWNLKYKG